MSSSFRSGPSWRFVLSLLLFALGIVGCRDVSGPTESTARIAFVTVPPSVVRTLVITVSGPGLDSAIVSNVVVNASGVASDTLDVPSGSARRFRVAAFDSAGVQTHAADTTIRLVPGNNPPLSLTLLPTAGRLTVTVTFGDVVVAMTAPDSMLTAGDTLRFTATARLHTTNVAADSIVWGSDAPGVVTVDGGLVRAVRSGSAYVHASYRGAVVRRRVVVRPVADSALSGTLVLVTGTTQASNEWSYASIGGTVGAPTIGTQTVFLRGARFATLSPDRQRTVFTGLDAAERIYRASAVAGATPTEVRGGRNYGLRASRTGGRYIWFEEGGCGQTCRQIFTTDSGFASTQQLTNDATANSHPSLSADGSVLLWSRTINGETSIWRMSLPSGTPQKLTSGGLHAHPSLSPDGTMMVYAAFANGSYSLVVSRADGTQPVTLQGTTVFSVGIGGLGMEPVWSPDSRTILFNGTPAGGTSGVYLIRADNSSAPVRLTPTNLAVNVYSWQ